MNNTSEKTRDEADVYRALIRAVAGGESEITETEAQPTPQKPAMMVGAYKLRRKLRRIDQ